MKKHHLACNGNTSTIGLGHELGIMAIYTYIIGIVISQLL